METHAYSPAMPEPLPFFTLNTTSSGLFCGESDEIGLAACFAVASKEENRCAHLEAACTSGVKVMFGACV